MSIDNTADSSDLAAYAPNGNRICATLEHAMSAWKIQSFYLNGEGRFVHEFSDSGPGGVDTDTADVEGQALYVDDADKIWPESALTFKTKDDGVVRAGVEMQPLQWPDLDKALAAYYRGFPVAAQQLQLAPAPAEPTGSVARALADAEEFLEAVVGTLDWARDHGASPDAIGGMQAMREKALSQVRAAREDAVAASFDDEPAGQGAVDRPRG